MKRIIFRGPDFCAVQEDGILVEYLQTETGQQYGDILIGKIERLMPGLGCAFVNIGRKLSGFLPLKENSISFSGTELRSGMTYAVQIRKEENGGKGAFLSRDLTVAGKYILLMPMNRYTAVSSRIREEADRENLRETGRKLSGGEFGIVMRSSSMNAKLQDLEQETYDLLEIWKAIENGLKSGGSAGTVLYHQDPVSRLISDYEPHGIDAVLETGALSPELERQLRESRERTVRLENGGSIVIDRCEAMTVIDVNTASSHPESLQETTFLETNLAACKAIAAQIRLRNLSGIILIDFIDMKEEQNKITISEKLQSMLQADRRKTVLHGWTKLNLMEMTRKRTES